MTSPHIHRTARPRSGLLDEDLLLLLHDVARLTRIETDRRARQHGMTRAQWVMLLKLARYPGLSQKDLAEILEVEPMSVARLTDRLESRGLVERRADPGDRRIWRLHLRSDAENIVGVVTAERAAIADLVTRDLSPSTLKTMLDGLARIKATLAAAGRAGHDAVRPEREPDCHPDITKIENQNTARETA